MSHFAEVENGTVMRVIVAEQDFIDSGAVGDPSRWLRCSYNTRGGVHLHGGTPLRKNYPGPGDVYDSVRDAFYTPQPYPSWTLNEDSCLWEAPVPYPTGETLFRWDEPSLSWVESA